MAAHSSQLTNSSSYRGFRPSLDLADDRERHWKSNSEYSIFIFSVKWDFWRFQPRIFLACWHPNLNIWRAVIMLLKWLLPVYLLVSSLRADICWLLLPGLQLFFPNACWSSVQWKLGQLLLSSLLAAISRLNESDHVHFTDVDWSF